jgi:hypothetical protein
VQADPSEHTSGDAQVAAFIRSSFRSVWDLELLCHLRRAPDSSQHPAALVTSLRASDLVIANSISGLLSAGLIVQQADQSVRYAPASAELDRLSKQADALYARSPGAIRRMIITASNPGIAAFADAFRLRKE